MENSIWYDNVCNTNMECLTIMNKDNLLNELKIFTKPFQKNKHLLNFIANNMRKIDHLRVNQIMHLIEANNRNTLIKMCSNSEFMIQTILTAQNVIHTFVTNTCLKIANDMRKHESKNGNENKDDSWAFVLLFSENK